MISVTSIWKKPILISLVVGFTFYTANNYIVDIYAEGLDPSEDLNSLEEQEYYFDFFPNTYELQNGKEIEINIEHKITDFDQSRWKVKPNSEEATIKIYNPETQGWVFPNNSWLEMPNAKGKLYIKGTSNQENVLLKLLIKDLETNKVYETPTKELFTTKAYKGYFEKINESAKTWRQKKRPNQSIDQKEEITVPKNQTKTLSDLRNTSNLSAVLLGASFLAGIVGFIRKSDKIPT